MGKINLNILLIAVIGLAVIASGCTGGQDVTSVVKALPEVQQFMKEHPNAKITVTYWSKEEVAKSAQEISQQCDKSITPMAMYKATVSEGDLKIVSWINAENQIVLCSTTTGSGIPSKITPTSTATTTTNQFKIINLDVQQVILSDSEIREVLGSDWEKTSQNKLDTPDHIQLMDLEYQTINSNTGDKKHILIEVGVSPNISYLKAGISNLPGNDIDIGDAGKVSPYSNAVGIIFIKNNILVKIGGSTTVGLETINKLARKQEEKIIRLLENPTSASAFTPIPISTLPGQMNSKSTQTTRESAAAISENFIIEAIDGTQSNGILNTLRITIRVASGGSAVDLSKVLIKVQGVPYNYAQAKVVPQPPNTFLVYALRPSSPTDISLGTISQYSTLAAPTLNSGALARLDVNVASLNLQQKASVTIALTPEKGTTVITPVTLPAFTTVGSISIYP